MKKNQNGFGIVEIVIGIVVLGLVGLLGFTVVSKLGDDKKKDDFKSTSDSSSVSGPQAEGFIWRQTASGWEAQETAPDCPAQPMLKAPADLSKVTSVLYPGQTRGGTSYKPHGGLRFDTTKDNTITVTAPMDGYVINGTRFIVDRGTEIQYGFSIMNNCGVMNTLGHLRELSPDLQKVADTFPEATMSSATQNINPPLYVKQGDVLATKVGTLGDHNTFFDWGVTDYRQQNEASKSQAYQSAHGENNGKDTAWYAVCWLTDWLPASNQATLAKLPAGDSGSGKNSDYCK
jgi:hypothetical protein